MYMPLYNTDKPVYNGQPWGLTKVAYVDSWSLFGTYIQSYAFKYFAVSA